MSDRNSSVDFLFKAVKDKMPEREAVPKTRSAECGFLKENFKKN